jgi:thiol-disulfide isomerase/thioredoxin
MRPFLLLLAITSILIAGCGEITIGQPQTKPEPVPSVPSEPEQVFVEREVLAFSAPWCSGCQKDKPQIADLRSRGVTITEINIDERPDLAEKYGITSVPTYVVLENGVEVERTQSIVTIISMIIWLLTRILLIVPV